MLNEALRRELLDLREEDRRGRNELADASELGGPLCSPDGGGAYWECGAFARSHFEWLASKGWR
jgi:hypothetical protein